MKKVVDQEDGTYRCERCIINKEGFKWRIALNINMVDCSGSNYATCFQVEQFPSLKV